MGKKKAKAVKKQRSKKGGSEDVRASTSLPPSVDGQLRCFLRVTVSKVSWLMGRPPETFYLRLKWWGEQSDGSIFRPSDGREETKSVVRKTARYPIRCGPKQFADYLNAMSTCVFELLKGQQMSCIGKVTVSELGLLAPQNPISGVYPIFSNQKAEKLGEVNISMKFEPLPVSYDSSSSVPTTDVSLPAHQGRQSATQPSILKKEKKKTSSVRSSSSYQPQSSDVEGSRRDRLTPSGVDNDYSFVVGPGAGAYQKPEGRTKAERDTSQTVKIIPEGTNSDTGTDIFSSSQRTEQSLTNRRNLEFQPTSDAGKHLISAILDKGNRLMDSMIRAQCEAQPTASKTEEPRSDPTPEPVRPLTGMYPLRRSSSGELFRELLKDDRSGLVVDEGVREASKGKMKKQDPSLELVVGDVITDKELNQVQSMLGNSPAESVDSDFDGVLDGLTTDSDDPLHEQSILEELFYKRQRSSSDSEGLSDILLSSDSETEVSRQRRMFQRKGKPRKNVPVKDEENEESPEKGTEIDEKDKESQMAGTKEQKEDGRDGKDEDDSLDTSSVASLLHSSRNGIDGLSVQRLTLLGRVHAARVVIDTLTLFEEGRRGSSGAGSRIPRRIADNSAVRGKPPRPQLKSTYFIEYQFPITATGEDSDYTNNMATEVMRVVSKKVTEMKGKTEIQFGHRSVFPLQFDGSTVDHWWTRLLVLRIYHKFAGEKTPLLMAVASVPLKKILQSPNLSVAVDLPVKRKDHQERRTSFSSFTTETTSTSPDDKSSHLGNVQISIQLTSDSKDFKTSLAKMKIDEMKGAKLISLPTLKIGNLKGSFKGNQTEPPVSVSPLRGVTSHQGEKIVPQSQRRSPREGQEDDGGSSSYQRTNLGVNAHASQDELTIYTLLLIPEGRGITVQGLKPLVSRDENIHGRSGPLGNTSMSPSAKHGRDFVTRNTYLVCRMFWSDDAVRSHVCWGTSHPQFNFSQVAPLLLTPSLLERTRNNFMVVEVWDKKTSGQNDELVGMAKLPLHQFYMSFRDQKIASTILKSQYPVVGIDTYAPIINPFSGVHFGQIKVLLAMGAFHQITALQRLKGDIPSDVPKPERPFHYLERSEQMLNKETQPPKEKEDHSQVEHNFEVVIEGVRSLPQGEDFVWGEADCFIQYHFPSQERLYNQIQGSLNLRSFRSATTLCLPDPVFNEVTRHRISLPANIPVQRELLTACVGVGGAAGCIPFELWCRYYYPNVREQVMAKASLPLAKLCAMVTMQRRGEPSVQTFNLPLRIIQDVEEGGHGQETSGGFLDVTVSYRHSTVRQEQQVSSQGLSVFSQVSLTVSVLRATGLQAAAKSLARYQPSLQYASEVGVNTFVTVHLSFLPKEEVKRSGTIARSFSPELSHHMDFSCPLILHTDGQTPGQMETETPLAEVLETADLEVKLWHQGQHADNGAGALFQTSEDNSISGRQIVAPPTQILLGSTSVPLKHMLLKKTGLHGWFTVNIPMHDQWALPQQSHSPEKSSSSKTYSRNEDGGSMELAIKFARKTDREKVLEVGHRMGWSPFVPLDEDDFSEGFSMPATVSVQIDKIFFNEQLALRPGQTGIGSDCGVFIRYQFYDKRPTCSSPFSAKLEHDGNVSVDTKLTQHIKLTTNPALNWYLKEEPFEIQIWVTSSQKSSRNMASHPNKTDKLIGSAYIDLITLITNCGRSRSISGLFPLCKPSTDNMYGACLRGSVTLNLGQHRQTTPTSTDEDGSDEHQEEIKEGERLDVEPAIEDVREADHSHQEPEPVMEPIPFELHIERAMGLCTSPQRSSASPLSSYVTLQVADSSSLITRTVADSTRPFWNHHQELVLDPQEVVEKQHLIFKIWLQTTGRQDMSCDRMLGFTSVDLGPLLVGFRSLNGWYNIMDFSSQVKGQIKIAITPKRDMTSLKKRATGLMNQMKSPNTSGHLPPMHSLHPYHQPSSQSGGPEEAGMSSQIRDRHHEKHIRGIRQSHERLQSQRRSWDKELEDPSLSLLKENLRKNLADLDSLKKKLDHKRRCLDGLEDSEKDEDKFGKLAGTAEREEVPPLMEGRTVSGSDETATGSFVADPRRDQSDLKHVQFDQMSQGNDPEDERTPSESLDGSGSENEQSSIIIPRTLNDVLPDDRRGSHESRDAEEGYIEEDGASLEEVRSETPEEALERIQNRILQVVGSGIPHEMGKDREDNSQTVDDSEKLVVEGKCESDLRVSGEEEKSVSQGEDEENSEMSGSFSDEEEAASFASSRDEGGGSDPRVGSATPSSHEKEHLDGEFGKPSISSEDEMGAISVAVEGKVAKSDEATEELKENLDGHVRETEPAVRSPELASPELPWQQPTEARVMETLKQSDVESQAKKRTKETSLAFQLPNFFLPGDDLASAMRNLDSAVSRPTLKSPEVGSLSERIGAAREVAKRMEAAAREERAADRVQRPKKFARMQPTAEEAKRIAKIFSAKYVSS